MSAARQLSDDCTLYVVMNGRVVGDINRTGKNKARLRYEGGVAGDFTPLSVSIPGRTGRYRETVLIPWIEALLPDRPETLRQWRRRFNVVEQSPLALMSHVGEDVAGAAQFVRPSRLDVVLDRTSEAFELTNDDVAETWSSTSRCGPLRPWDAESPAHRSSSLATPVPSSYGVTTGIRQRPAPGAAYTKKTCARRSPSGLLRRDRQRSVDVDRRVLPCCLCEDGGLDALGG